MRIAVLGATSQIAKDLVRSFAEQRTHELELYARRTEAVKQWLNSVDLPARFLVHDFDVFNSNVYFDAILNFVGVGNPAQAAAMGATIFEVTLQYDEVALEYLRQHPTCRYIFLSSGAAYGSSFEAPVDENSKATLAVNDLRPLDWYGVAKLHAECRHRSLAPLPIVDIRVFNYFSHTQDMDARFLITDIVRAIRDQEILTTSAENIARDFITPPDFNQLVDAILTSPPTNAVVDCYSKASIDKSTLLAELKAKFGLKYELTKNTTGVNATGTKAHYYSLNTSAALFGYLPALSSLDGVVQEIHQILRSSGKSFR